MSLACSADVVDTDAVVDGEPIDVCGTPVDARVLLQAGGPELAVFLADDLVMTGSLRFTGDRVPVFLVFGDATMVNVTIDAGASAVTPGAGSAIACTSLAGSGAARPTGGGGGGGSRTNGGGGGSSTQATGPSGGLATMGPGDMITGVVQGGCPGGPGGSQGGLGGADGGGGGGGGAGTVLIEAASIVPPAAVVTVGGGGGGGGAGELHERTS